VLFYALTSLNIHCIVVFSDLGAFFTLKRRVTMSKKVLEGGNTMSLELELTILLMALGIIPDFSAWYAIGDDLI
jgi:hypothetical protein